MIEINVMSLLSFWGIPGAIITLIIWFFKRWVEKRDKDLVEHNKQLQELCLMMLQSTRANTILGIATAEAVRDGHCNGNMTSALEAVDKVARAEKEFLLDKSIKYIFE